MAKGYILSAHRSPADSKKRDAYTKLAIPAFEDAGGPRPVIFVGLKIYKLSYVYLNSLVSPTTTCNNPSFSLILTPSPWKGTCPCMDN